MKCTALRWIAAASALLAFGTVEAARRPRYGGELRIEMGAVLENLNPSEVPADPGVLAAKESLLPQVFETLVRLDERGEPQPWLATSWTRDAARKRWMFAARSNVMLHNGAPWTPPGGVIEVPDDQPVEQILRDMARPRNAIAVRADDGSLVGTGPFKIASAEAGKSLTLAAHEGYWGGRPYLDSIHVQMGRALGDQTTDFELGKTDVIEGQLTEPRQTRQGTRPFLASPTELLALAFENTRIPANAREAVALSIDRAAIQGVILQKQGEPSAALLPRWLSGYSFLFNSERNVARARQLAASAPPLTFAYDIQSPLLRPVAQRIEVNASEAGLTIRRSTGSADLRLIKLPILSRDPWTALQDLTALLKLPWPIAASTPYEAERTLLGDFLVIPIVQIPQAWRVKPSVKNWPRLADVWLDPLPDRRDKP